MGVAAGTTKKAAPDLCPKRLLSFPGTGLCRGATYDCSADYRRGTTGLKFACPRLPKGSTFEPDPLGLIRTRLAKRAKLPASRACCSWVPALPSMLEKPTTPTGFQLSSSSSQVEELYSAKELTMFCHWRNPLLL